MRTMVAGARRSIGNLVSTYIRAGDLRYEIVGVAAGGQGVQGIAYRLDRWTGSVEWMQASRIEPVEQRHGGLVNRAARLRTWRGPNDFVVVGVGLALPAVADGLILDVIRLRSTLSHHRGNFPLR